VVLYAKIFGANIFTLARYLDAQTDISYYVMTDMKSFEGCLSQSIHPLQRAGYIFYDDINKFRELNPDFCIVTNTVPDQEYMNYIQIHHGFGWKGEDLRKNYEREPSFDEFPFIKYSTAYSEYDKKYRNGRGYSHDKIITVGEIFSDDLLDQKFSTDDIKRCLKISENKIILFSPSWDHSGRSSGFFGNMYKTLMRDIIEFVAFIKMTEEKGFHVILRFHEKKRYKRHLITQVVLWFVSKKFTNITWHYLNEEPDPLPFLQIADLMISDISSIITYMYILEKPVILITSDDYSSANIFPPNHNWRIPMTDLIGEKVHNADSLLNAIQEMTSTSAVDYNKMQRKFVKRYFHNVDGGTAERFMKSILNRLDLL
jgi:CDP-glycerol glycerophosphotransferase (TagB/SpsB family)